MDTKERLKHASEVLGWLAEGKKLLCRRPGTGMNWEPAPGDESEGEAVKFIILGLREYRIKPKPVEFVGVVRMIPSWRDSVVILDAARFPGGTKVRVTVVES